MGKTINIFIYIGIAFTILFGFFLHFAYDLSAKNPIVGIFCPVNESTWEHLKLLYFPMSLYLIGSCHKMTAKYENFPTAGIIGLLAGMLSITAYFYTYTGIIGKNYLTLDILCFVFGVITAFFIIKFVIKNYALNVISPLTGIIFIEIIFVIFAIFTVFPPNINLFISPV